MYIYEVIGFESRKGVSKKTGRPYDMAIIHVVNTEPLVDEGCYGNRVESITYNCLVNGALTASPVVGDKIKVYYNRTGFVSAIEIVKA